MFMDTSLLWKHVTMYLSLDCSLICEETNVACTSVQPELFLHHQSWDDPFSYVTIYLSPNLNLQCFPCIVITMILVNTSEYMWPYSVIKSAKNTSNCKYEQGNKKLFLSKFFIHNSLHCYLNIQYSPTMYIHILNSKLHPQLKRAIRVDSLYTGGQSASTRDSKPKQNRVL
jgi:hypothetical protein